MDTVTATVTATVLCEDCGQRRVPAFPRPRRCATCCEVYASGLDKDIKKPLGTSRKARIYWNEAEEEALRKAAQDHCTFDEAAARVNAVSTSPGRTREAVRAHAKEYFITGFRKQIYRGGSSKRYWTPARVAPIHEAVRAFGPRGAAAQLGINPNVVAGILNRYPLPAQED